MLEIDLHGLSPEGAKRRLATELHTARVRGERSVRVITGRGWGNRLQQPVLRRYIEGWLVSPAGRRLRVGSYRVTSSGGALDVELG